MPVSGGVRDLRRIQLAKEEYGYWAPVAPTTQLVGGLVAREPRARVFVSEASGIMAAHRRTHDGSVIAELGFDAGDEGATFEQLIILLSMGVCGGIEPPTPVGAAGYRWIFAPNMTAGNVPDIYTLYYGDNIQCWQTESAFARSLTLAGATEESWLLTGDLVGDQMDPGGEFHPGISYPTPLETILAQLTSLYIDDTYATIGDTPVLGTLIDWSITIPGYHPKFFQDGVLVYSGIGLASRALEVSMTYEFNAEGAAEHALFQAGTPRFIRLLAQGSQINAPADYHEAQIDMCLIWDTPGPDALDERDGNDIVTFTGRTVYDADFGRDWQIEVQNTIDALP